LQGGLQPTLAAVGGLKRSAARATLQKPKTLSDRHQGLLPFRARPRRNGNRP